MLRRLLVAQQEQLSGASAAGRAAKGRRRTLRKSVGWLGARLAECVLEQGIGPGANACVAGW